MQIFTMPSIGIPSIPSEQLGGHFQEIKKGLSKVMAKVSEVALLVLKSVVIAGVYYLFPDLFFTGVVLGFAFPDQAIFFDMGLDDAKKAFSQCTTWQKVGLVTAGLLIATLHMPACVVALNLYASTQIGAWAREKINPDYVSPRDYEALREMLNTQNEQIRETDVQLREMNDELINIKQQLKRFLGGREDSEREDSVSDESSSTVAPITSADGIDGMHDEVERS